MGQQNTLPGAIPGAPFFEPNTPLPVATTAPLPFDNNITEDPNDNGGYYRVQNFPDNGPYRPAPVPGPNPTHRYEYLLIPRQKPVPPTAPYYAAFSVYQAVEYQIALLGVYAERINLWDGSRAYRVPIQYMWRFPYDKIGPFVGAPSQQPTQAYPGQQPTIFRFTTNDPVAGQSVTDFWTSLLG